MNVTNRCKTDLLTEIVGIEHLLCIDQVDGFDQQESAISLLSQPYTHDRTQ